MKERPIIFSAPMVHAILEGRKTQTRRVVKNPRLGQNGRVEPYGNGYGRTVWGTRVGRFLRLDGVKCPYGQPGDRLWVRETWAQLEAAGTPYIYRADADEDGSVPYLVHGSPMGGGVGHANPHRWKPSIHMPRRASRILLEIVSVRVERLRDISEADALEEGADYLKLPSNGLDPEKARRWFRDLWMSINGINSWNANPWVWAVEFRRITP